MLFRSGLGFDREATGWQNIYYRGYLQGETPRSIAAKLEQIAEFSELGDFLDAPLKCYSSGMLMRLAFSIATAIEPEILLVDEVFATGDVVFQAKARRRMSQLLGEAHVVVMAGHDRHLMEEFCDRVVWMDKGRVRADGPAAEVLDEYLSAAPRPVAVAA